jgi:hypothetical protein
MKGKNINQKQSTMPGPSSYYPSIDFSIEKFPSYRIGTSKREMNFNRFNGPGPASYSLDFSTLSGPKWKIGNSVRKMFRMSETPGPDVYKIPPPNTGVSYSISPSKSIKKINETPGPGTYSPTNSEKSPRPVIGTGKRETKVFNTTPGPGTYDPDAKAFSQKAVCKNLYRFGSSKRNGQAPRSSSPGPGEYFIPTSLGGPRFSIRKKLPKLKTMTTPVLNM